MLSKSNTNKPTARFIDIEGSFVVPVEISHEQFIDMICDWCEEVGVSYDITTDDELERVSPIILGATNV